MSTDVTLNCKNYTPRFLTAYKIGILTVCSMYCEELIPKARSMGTMLPILRFIDGSAHSFDNILDSDIHQLKRLLGDAPSVTECSLYELVLGFLWRLDSPNELHNFFLGIEKHMDHPATELGRRYFSSSITRSGLIVSDGSILDQFFRKAVLSFEGLQFDGIVELWTSFRAFLEPSRPEWDAINIEGNMDLDKSPLQIMAEKALTEPLTVTYDPYDSKHIGMENIDALLEHCHRVMVKYGIAVDPPILDLIRRLVATEPNISAEAYSVLYMDACRYREQTQAIDYLHRYFDYNQDLRTKSKYQLALFNLAHVHNDLDGIEEALRAAEEAVAVAREKDDNVTLATITIWLFRFIRCQPRCKLPDFFADKQQLLQFLQNRAKDQSSLELAFVAQHFEAQQLLDAGEPVGQLMESVLKCSNLLALTQDLDYVRKLQLLQEKMWNRMGTNALASAYLELALQKYPNERPHGHNYMDGIVVKAHRELAQGRIPEALDCMYQTEQFAQEVALLDRQWVPELLLIQAKAHLVKGNARAAESCIDQLRAIGYERLDSYDEIRSVEIQIKLMQHDYTAAYNTSLDALDEHLTRVSTDTIFQSEYLGLYVRTQIESGNPTRAYTACLRLLAMTKGFGHVVEALRATVYLAEILVLTNQCAEASFVLDQSIPAIVECGASQLLADAYVVLGKAMSQDPQRKQQTHSVWTRALHLYRASENTNGVTTTQQLINDH